MEKTAIIKAIELHQDRMAQYTSLLENLEIGTLIWYECTAKEITLKYVIEDLRSLLPTERQSIEAAFDNGALSGLYEENEMGVPRDPLYSSASDYYEQTYSQTDKTKENGK